MHVTFLNTVWIGVPQIFTAYTYQIFLNLSIPKILYSYFCRNYTHLYEIAAYILLFIQLFKHETSFLDTSIRLKTLTKKLLETYVEWVNN